MKLPRIPYWPLLLGPYLALGLGFLMNALVIAANRGQMPVLFGACTPALLDGNPVHACMTIASHLKFLADWIFINGVGIASPGDFLVWLCYNAATPINALWAALVIKDYNGF